MGLTGCCGVIKYLIILINIIFWIFGIAILILAGYMLAEPSFLFSMIQAESNYYIGISLVLIVGALMVIGGFLGCFGVCKESQCMLVSFFCCLLVILVAQIAACSWAFYNKDKLDMMVRASVEHTVKEEYDVITPRTVVFDAIQKHLNCCGATNYHDWSTAKFNTKHKQQPKDVFEKVTLTLSSALVFNLPKSCCKKGLSKIECDNAVRDVTIAAAINPNLNTAGCKDKIIDEIDDHFVLIVCICAAIVIIEIFGLIFSILICCAIKRNDHYKA